jgi:hypothetical protein
MFILAIATMVLGLALGFQMISDLIVTIGAISKKGSAKGATTCHQIAVIIGLVGSLGMIAGYVFGIFAPSKAGTLGLAIATLAVGGVSLVLSILFIVIPAFNTPIPLGIIPNFYAPPFGITSLTVAFIMQFLTDLAFAAALILYPMFLRAVAIYFKDRGHGQDCLTLVFLVGGFAATTIIADILGLIWLNGKSREASNAMFWVNAVVRWIADLFLGGVLSWYVIILFRSKAVVD